MHPRGMEGHCKAALNELLQLTGSSVGAAVSCMVTNGRLKHKDLSVIHENLFHGVLKNAENGLH